MNNTETDFERIYEENLPHLLTCACIWLSSVDDAWDAVQYVFEKFIYVLNGTYEERGKVRSYLLTSLRHVTIDSYRHHGVESRVVLPLFDNFSDLQLIDTSLVEPEELVIQSETRQKLYQVLPLISSGNRQVVQGLLAGESQEEICIELNLNAGAYRQRLRRAITELRVIMDIT